MRLSNILSPKKLRLIFLLVAFLVAAFAAFPWLKTGKIGVFYSIDPDVVYLSNSLSFIKTNLIHYFDHPGTLSIWLLSFSFLPLRIITKFWYGQNFILWAFDNYDFVLFYSRVFQTILFALGLSVLLYSSYKLSGKITSALYILLGLLSFLPFYFLAGSVNAEVLSFVLIALFCFCLASFIKKEENWSRFTMFFIAGLAFGNRATNIFLVPVSLLANFIGRDRFKIRFLIKTSLLILGGFLFSLWPLKERVVIILKRLVFFAGSTEIHGTGEKMFFDLRDYTQSVKSLVSVESEAALFFLVSVFIIAAWIIRRRGMQEKLMGAAAAVVVIFIFGFAKFPLAHYQLTAYTLLLFCGGYFLSKFKKQITLPVLMFLFILVPNKSIQYYSQLKTELIRTAVLEKFVKENPPEEAAVWEWGRSKDFSLIWSRSWAGALFEEEMIKERPDLLEISTDFKKVKTNYTDEKDLFEICWDHLYIQEVSLERFLDQNPERKLELRKIDGTGMYLLTSDHCKRVNLPKP